ncbi:sensor histidine kinase [Ktedonosporobacter rubrisoli]|uniref:Sensor histidine kinase n=1 Tax=Ktedonosporobacter rubrisoli TaxID=2509675 RepID=A0A4P6JXA7_KTERU|nr:sensor histidine kinase [Ktedonosporobacter rubrisoli]QBD80379.1 sensor histidine kinase [Ktedonosporobacter rubrisoli]
MEAKIAGTIKNLGNRGALHWFPLIWVDLIYLWYSLESPIMSDPPRLVLFTLLMVLHGDLYLLGLRQALARKHAPFLVGQGLLLLLISFVAADWLVTFGLYLAFVVKAVELLEHVRPGLGAAISYLILALLIIVVGSLHLAGGDRYTLGTFLVLCLLCLGGYVLLFLRQAQSQQRGQHLLAELKSAHADLAAAHAQLAAYAVDVEERSITGERQRLARELHDTLTQSMVGLVLQLEAIDAKLAAGQPERAHAIVKQALARARATFAEARHVIHALRSELNESVDFCEALEEEIARFSAATGIICQAELALCHTIAAWQGEHVLHMVKEGLTNIARHAHARHAWISLRRHTASMYVEVRDDGVGFDPLRIVAGHYGLLGLRERAQLIGGQLEVHSVAGEGSRLRLIFPTATGEEPATAMLSACSR